MSKDNLSVFDNYKCDGQYKFNFDEHNNIDIIEETDDTSSKNKSNNDCIKLDLQLI